ncbi:MAG: hypothetical protein COA94_08165, partial [Rickettsiales bacterium]
PATTSAHLPLVPAKGQTRAGTALARDQGHERVHTQQEQSHHSAMHAVLRTSSVAGKAAGKTGRSSLARVPTATVLPGRLSAGAQIQTRSDEADGVQAHTLNESATSAAINSLINGVISSKLLGYPFT